MAEIYQHNTSAHPNTEVSSIITWKVRTVTADIDSDRCPNRGSRPASATAKTTTTPASIRTVCIQTPPRSVRRSPDIVRKMAGGIILMVIMARIYSPCSHSRPPPTDRCPGSIEHWGPNDEQAQEQQDLRYNSEKMVRG